MSGNTEDELEIIETEDENIPEIAEIAEEPPAEDAKADPAPSDAEEDEDDDEDERLGDDREASDEDIEASTKSKRLKRRRKQREARDRTLAQLTQVQRENQLLAQRLAALEGSTLAQNENEIDRRISEAEADMRRANAIIAKAVEAGNGADVAAAIDVRDEIRRKLDGYSVIKARVTKAREEPEERNTRASIDPRVQNFGEQWMRANSWYDPSGGDEDSAIVNAIDRVLVQEGFDPASRDYWEELTDRVKARLSGPSRRPSREKDTDDDPPRRRAPPIGVPREHAPASTRKQVVVTPERKRAMVEAGAWDDPVKRQKYLKAYRDYDLNNSAR